jgi:hypothetical protein
MTLDTVASADRASPELAFADVVLADEELLRSEFEAIVAAGWPAPPDEPVPAGADAEEPRGGGRAPVPRPRRSRSTSTGRRAGYPPLRQRSPPGQPGGEPAIAGRHNKLLHNKL